MKARQISITACKLGVMIVGDLRGQGKKRLGKLPVLPICHVGARRFGLRTVSAQLIVGFGQEKTMKQAIP